LARLETAVEWIAENRLRPPNQPLEASRAEEAAAAFQASLKAVLNNGWAIYGLMEAQKKLGDEAGAKASEAELAEAWAGPRYLLDLSKL